MSSLSGKKPVSQKPKRVNVLDEPDFFMNKLAIESSLKEEIKGKDLDCRWISYTKYVASGGQHERGWSVYKRDKREGMDSFILGNSPDGIIRVGDNVLAVRPNSYSKKHRAWLAAKASRMSGTNEAKAEELRQKAKEANVDITVHEGFEENE